MEQRATTLMTKKALAASLKKLMETKPLDKISVREIVEDCGVNRKTFYYHFQNIYDLVNWMFEEEAIEVVKKYNLITNYEDAIRFSMDYIKENEHVVNSALDAVGRDELKKFFYNNFFGTMSSIVDQLSEGMNVPNDYKEFLINFYTESFASLLIDWIRNRANRDKEKYIKYISLTLFSTIRPDLERADREFN